MNDAHVCVRFFVSGRVQGVFFRGSTAAEAGRLGLSGSAVNLPDGRVEVLAIGPADAVAQLAKWLEHGPRWASVSSVEAHEEDPVAIKRFDGFTTA